MFDVNVRFENYIVLEIYKSSNTFVATETHVVSIQL